MEHLLIIRFSALGDIAMTIPVIDTLGRQYPDLRITVLSRNYVHPLFEQMPPNVHFMGADLKEEYKGWNGLNALYRRLAAKHFTLIADFHDVLRSQFLRMRFSLDRNKVAHISKGRSAKHKLVRSKNKRIKPLPTSFERYADVLAQLGYPIVLDFKSIYQYEEPNVSLSSWLIERKKKEDHWIGIAPFAGHSGKVYPQEKMEEVIRQLTTMLHVRVFLFGGGKKEQLVLEEWEQKFPNTLSIAGKLKDFGKELFLMHLMDVIVSMDSANMHLASLVGTPVISIWGATHPFAGFMGWNQNPDDAIQIDLLCRPCSVYGNKACLRGDYACMYNISPGMIIEKIKKHI